LKFKWTLKYVIPAAIVIFVVSVFPETIGTIAIVALPVYYILIIRHAIKVKKSKQTTGAPKLTNDKLEHYKEAGLSESDIKVFRDTMAKAREDVKKWEANVQLNSKLTAIDLRTEGVKGAKAMFKELVKEPNRLTEASEFLYKHLPNMVELSDKYIEISAHEIKNKETYDTLDKSANVIEVLSNQIAKDYTDFVKNDIDDMDIEVKLAKKNLKVDNDSEVINEGAK
jgi:5-bromo-4-chloroindolyl phosphate hydrolysis protein